MQIKAKKNYRYQHPWEITELEGEQENNSNPEVINQHLLPVIVINQPPIEPIGQSIQPLNQQNQQLPPVPPQQQQQLLSPQQQQMAYAPIAKLNKFNGEENDAQVWLNNVAKAITANNWNDARVMQPTPLQLSNKKIQKQSPLTWDAFIEIYAKYKPSKLTISQGLCSSILQRVRPIHPVDLSTAVTYARDFEAAKLEANHTQAMNLAMNGSSELDSKLKQFSDSINQKLKRYLANNRTIYQTSQWCNNQGNANHFQNQSHLSLSSNQLWQPEMHICHNCDSEPSPESRPIPTHLSAYDTPTNLSTASLSNSSLSITATSNLSGAATSNISTTATSNLSNTHYLNTTNKLSSNDIREPKIENHPKLEISDGCTSTDPQLFLPIIKILSVEFGHHNLGIEQQQSPTNNIPPATITENESLDAIFPFELEELSKVPLFNRVVLEKKLIIAMYTDVKIDDHSIKLILNSDHRVDCAASTKIITTNGAIKTPIGKIDNFPIEVNGIIVPIKVLVIEATQYQALIVSAMYGHFKATNTTAPLIDFEEKKPKSTWEAYQVLWANEEHNKLPPILSWDNNGKGKQKRTEPTWNADQA
ncbi:hypothetical protein G9A89_014953 [Geosiphon pyriformis]|nr:hypothetical protein G9A89_014953 [Geosiphon pyriformis]